MTKVNKKYNNDSRYFRDWTTDKLEDEAENYYNLIYNLNCYGMDDLMNLEGIVEELKSRGIKPVEILGFELEDTD